MANRSAALPLLNHDSCFVRKRSVTQAWALKVSAVPGATHNRIGSNRYRHRSAGAGVGPPGETPVAVKRDARVSWFSLIGDRGFESVSLQRRVRLSAASTFEGQNPGFPRGCALTEQRTAAAKMVSRR